MFSESLIERLSKESNDIRYRCNAIKESLIRCKNKSLIYRLRKELDQIELRRSELLKLAIEYKNNLNLTNISVDLFIEISSRPAPAIMAKI